ncbi:myb/SANT-like domain-containing protein [Artemisia annua]|uniref:Myb/SANT-like domain-containing protein n=1 Tax=Artemisia annua TaxID=35608 RepID=A0A2U1Q745_ARTAN|nr:myb/SANT-like domain-containing protein [Artemisia annua]
MGHGERKEYNFWTSLKNGAAGIGWDASTGTLNCSDEWWEKKMQENDKFKRLRKKQPSLELQEAWYQLFGDKVAIGVEVVAPSINPITFNDSYHVNLEDEDVDLDAEDHLDANIQYSQEYSILSGLFSGGQLETFLDGVGSENVSTSNQIGGSKHSKKSTKTNVESRKEYNFWTSLKNGAAGIGWDASTGTLNCSDEWWEKKILENDKFKRLRKKQPSLELQEAWYQLFGDKVAIGVEVAAPSINPSTFVAPSTNPITFNDSYHVNIEDEDVDLDAEDHLDANIQYSQEYSILSGLFSGGQLETFLDGVGNENVSTSNQIGGSKHSKKSTKTNVESVISVVNRMVEQKPIAEYDDLWCFGMNVLEDRVKREFFLNFPVDA